MNTVFDIDSDASLNSVTFNTPDFATPEITFSITASPEITFSITASPEITFSITASPEITFSITASPELAFSSPNADSSSPNAESPDDNESIILPFPDDDNVSAPQLQHIPSRSLEPSLSRNGRY